MDRTVGDMSRTVGDVCTCVGQSGDLVDFELHISASASRVGQMLQADIPSSDIFNPVTVSTNIAILDTNGKQLFKYKYYSCSHMTK